MEMTKSEKSLEKSEKKIFFRDFFRYDVIQERAWFKAFPTPIFNIFFQIRLWKFQINLIGSFGDTSKKPKGRAFFRASTSVQCLAFNLTFQTVFNHPATSNYSKNLSLVLLLYSVYSLTPGAVLDEEHPYFAQFPLGIINWKHRLISEQ